MTKLAPEWVRTSDPLIRSPARYRWTTAPAIFLLRTIVVVCHLNLYITSCLGRHWFFDVVTPLYWAVAAVSVLVTSQVRVWYCTLLCFIDKTRCVSPDSWFLIISHIQISVSSETWSKQDLSWIYPGFRAGWQLRLPSKIKFMLEVFNYMWRTNKNN